MGALLSTVTWYSFFPSFFSRPLALPPPYRARPSQPDPHLLLSAAAELAAIQRSMEAQQGSSTASSANGQYWLRLRNRSQDDELDSDYSHDTDETSSRARAHSVDPEDQNERRTKNDETTTSSGGSSGQNQTGRCLFPSPDEYDREMKRRREAACERFIISDEEAYGSLRAETTFRCGPSTSVMQAKRSRELGTAGRKCLYSPSLGQKTHLNNRFFPNCRKVVDKLRTKMFCCQYVQNGRQLVVASQDEHIRFYEHSGYGGRLVNTKSLRVLNVGWSILDIAVVPDGTSFAYATWKDAVLYARLCEPSPDSPGGLSFTSLHIPEAESPMAVFSVRFSADQSEVVAGASDRGIHVFDLESQIRVVGIENAHQDDVNAVCYGDVASHLIYSGGDDGIVKVWDRRALGESDGRPVGMFAGHHDGITYIDSRGDNRFLISNSKDQSIKLWDLRKFSSESAADATRREVSGQSWDYRWQPAPSGPVERIPGDTSIVTLRGHSLLHTLIRAKFSPHRTGQRYVYTGCSKGAVVVYDLLTGSVCRRLPGHSAVVREASWHPDGHEIASCGWDGVTAIWRWDERRDHVTGEAQYIGDEDSCDEMYCVERKRKLAKSKCKKRRTGPAGAGGGDATSASADPSVFDPPSRRNR